MKRCAECNREFKPWPGRIQPYCSRACGWAVQQRVAEANTPPAEELFEFHHVDGMSLAAIGRRYGRSASWAKEALARRGVPQRAPHKPKVLACVVCETEFKASPSEIERGRRYCSRACQFKDMPSPAKSPAARAKNAESKRGARNPMWKGQDTEGSVYRVFNARLKGEDCCRNCGRSDQILHLHHIVPRSMCKAGIRDLRNGVTLCAACHLGWHRRSIVIHRDILTAEEWEFVSSLELLGQNVEAWLDDRYPAASEVAA